MSHQRHTPLAIPDGLLGREVDLGSIAVTPAMIANYARAVGDVAVLESDLTEAPPTFCTALRRGMTPEVELPPGLFGVHGGHDIEVFAPIRAGHSYRMSARITDVFEKSGRSGRLTVVVREVTVRDATSAVVARIVERQIIRERPAAP